MKKSRLSGVVNACVYFYVFLMFPVYVGAVTVVADNFNDGYVDDAWQVTTQNSPSYDVHNGSTY